MKASHLQTQYTVAALLDPGWLCHDCAKASGMDPFKKPAAPRKRMPQEAKRKIAAIEEKPLPTLASLCIEVRFDLLYVSQPLIL